MTQILSKTKQKKISLDCYKNPCPNVTIQGVNKCNEKVGNIVRNIKQRQNTRYIIPPKSNTTFTNGDVSNWFSSLDLILVKFSLMFELNFKKFLFLVHILIMIERCGFFILFYIS